MDRVDPLHGCRPVRTDELEELATRAAPQSRPVLAYDVYRTADEIVIEFDVPGVDPSHLVLAVDGAELTVSARRDLPVGDGVDIVDARRAHGSFRERLLLGSRWDLARMRARLEGGVLSVRAPLAAAAHRVVPVEVSGEQGGSDGARHGGAGADRPAGTPASTAA